MTWELMIDRLSRGGNNGHAYAILVNGKATYSSLKERLSSRLKNMEGGTVANLPNIWTQALDHVFTVLNSIEFLDKE